MESDPDIPIHSIETALKVVTISMKGKGRGRITSAELFSPRVCFQKSDVIVNVLDNPVREKHVPAPVKKPSYSTSEKVENPESSSLAITSTGESLRTPSGSKDHPPPETTKFSKVYCAEASSSSENELNPTAAQESSAFVTFEIASVPSKSHNTASTLAPRMKTLSILRPKKADRFNLTMERVEAWIQSTAEYSGRGSSSSKDDDMEKTFPEGEDFGGTSAPSNCSFTANANDPAKFKGSSSTTHHEPVSSELQPHPFQPLPEDISPPPKGFQGLLIKGESWRYCPYYEGHTYLKSTVHLVNCRNKYIAECDQKGKIVDIGICRFHYDHHVHINRLEEHENNCDEQAMRNNSYLQYMKDKQVEVAMDAQKAKHLLE